MTIHGLEATHEGTLYRHLIPPFIRRQTQLVAVSEETKRAVDAGLPGARVVVVNNGIRDVFYAKSKRQDNLRIIVRETGLELSQLEQSRILYSNGRLVKRKGVQWFVENVMPGLVQESDQPLLYLISSTGPDQAFIEETIRKHHLEAQVKLLGRIPDDLRDILYNTADIFVMPNIPVPNDMEGFGLVALEAASCGTMVVASNLEGISDAIHDSNNGLLVEPQNADEYRRTILTTLRRPSLNPMAVRNYTLAHYSWETAATEYIAVMQNVSKS
jgi:phosphatidylinositol alpha-1,6-mannosyltransferase